MGYVENWYTCLKSISSWGLARGEWSNRMGSAAQECPPTTDLERANVRIPFYSVFYPYTWRIALRARQIKAKIELWFMEH